MLGLYFSGTGNSRYALETFLSKQEGVSPCFAIESISNEKKDVIHSIEENEEIVFSYPVQYSNIPKIVRDFIDSNSSLWKNKRIFVIATMGLFSGDGAGILARRLAKYGAEITGGLHLKMPDSIADVKALKRSLEENKKLVWEAERKIDRAVQSMKEGRPPQEGMGLLSHIAGFFGQRLYFYKRTDKYSSQIVIDKKRCTGCGKCEKICPMGNLRMMEHSVRAADKCTMCYRCINTCSRQAITLLGKRVVTQGTIEKYTIHGGTVWHH